MLTQAILLAVDEVSTAKMLIEAGGWTACVVCVLVFLLVVFKWRLLVHSDELKNERAERIKETAAWEKRLDDERKHHAEVVKLKDERYNDLEEESTSRLDLLRGEKDMWRQMALKAANVAETATANVKSGG